MIDFKTLCHQIDLILRKNLPLDDADTPAKCRKMHFSLMSESESDDDNAAAGSAAGATAEARPEWIRQVREIVDNPRSVLPRLSEAEESSVQETLAAFVAAMVRSREQLCRRAEINDAGIAAVLRDLDEYNDVLAVGDFVEKAPQFGSGIAPKLSFRYPNIYPVNHSMVTVDGRAFHANRVPVGNAEAIMTQAPLPSAINDFWQLVWEQKVPTIVMLTRMVENSRQKAHLYWPVAKNEPKRFGDIKVTCVDAEDFDGGIKRTFTLEKGGETRTVIQVHYSKWPDFGAPTLTAFQELQRVVHETEAEAAERAHAAIAAVREEQEAGACQSALIAGKSHREMSNAISMAGIFALGRYPYQNGPTVYHCSAGIGRTGTLVLADILAGLDLSGLSAPEKFMRVAYEVAVMRLYRHGAVQSFDQFKLLAALTGGCAAKAEADNDDAADHHVSGAAALLTAAALPAAVNVSGKSDDDAYASEGSGRSAAEQGSDASDDEFLPVDDGGDSGDEFEPRSPGFANSHDSGSD